MNTGDVTVQKGANLAELGAELVRMIRALPPNEAGFGRRNVEFHDGRAILFVTRSEDVAAVVEGAMDRAYNVVNIAIEPEAPGDRTLASEFETMLEQAWPGGMSPEQRADVRRVFYSGALAFHVLMCKAAAESHESADRLVGELMTVARAMGRA
jgi:hypothetical protein